MNNSNLIVQSTFNQKCADIPKVEFLMLVAGIAFAIFIFLTVLGNLLVIITIIKDKRFHTPSNYLIFSLAITDLIVGVITVPLRVFVEFKHHGEWHYGAFWCDIRVIIDRISVDASIYHILAIAFDRYLSVTNINYALSRNNKHVGSMIFACWALATFFGTAAFFGWRDKNYLKRIEMKNCIVSTDLSLNLTIWICVYLIPVILMIILYIRVFKAAKKSISNKPGNSRDVSSHSKSDVDVKLSNLSTESADNRCIELNPNNSESTLNVEEKSVKPNRLTTEEKRERKIAKTLFIITATLTICWFPFFTYYALSTVFGIRSASHGYVFKIVLWIGYFNSLLNPIIYAVFNQYYRDAFKKLLKMK